ncbi:MAG: hypothetical protein A3I77_01970 [Gammaproteobacteria bacterium RIFCSPLOWO2_02_FULL_42_14]|nr:MAG: hypothetical protein A3B71_00675 [Gammaproteobacteria bacterium RIFCSPHIGHO2_02_FULL_42_43]OGT28280.1 MAG: hypothetical protein A2624_02240 [Gammaproteobacteria bacterium RIFCSPHIGHO2_01_FULL_42_8]OGT52124.1 MAG: hypothetical protein A3E54_06805 [Gammaproteobacteria bacterium RIFCSPHIGHO2_12_FULL_41_25]OGT62561.1 MAG: hypothetical protein A3I77_01970 [Gammaproteobacteria bacterium RIFCSPLOWO2_02_FULL_42_14]OGT86544.1 MAG: hypothetical protein A3G86_08490 [Gammaproteobacteria bacterium R
MPSIADTIIYGKASEVAAAARANEHLNFIDEYGYTPLIEACIVDDIEKVNAILACNPDINFPDLLGNTALYWAVDNHNMPLCELLLEKGANPNAYNIAGKPILVSPLLRNQTELKNILIKHGAKLVFAQDFIHVKMLGHRFELQGYVDIINTQGEFVEVALEGFILEFTLDALGQSLLEYRNNFRARYWEREFVKLRTIIGALSRACYLTRFQRYNVDYRKHLEQLVPSMEEDPLIIPVAQEGHAMTLIRAGNLLAICDRALRDDQDSGEDKVKIYYMNKPWKLTPDTIAELIYVQQEMQLFHKILPANLGLQEIASMPLRAQIAGNCSWANIEACIPTLFYMLCVNNPGKTGECLVKDKMEAMRFFHDWERWDQDRSLHYFTHGIEKADKKRRACIAEMLCAVLFEACDANNLDDRERINKIVPVITTPDLHYIPESYLNPYYRENKTAAGENFRKMLRLGGDVFEL